MGVVKQGLGCDFDRLHELVNGHKTLPRFLGHSDVWDEHRYRYQTLVDSVNLVCPEQLVEINRLIVESGHVVAGKKPGAPLRGRCDSFVVETDVHYPTDVSLMWDAMRCQIRKTGRAAAEHDVAGWRHGKHLMRSVQKLFHKVRSTRRARPQRVSEYLARCHELVEHAEATLPDLIAQGACAWNIERIEGYLSHATRRNDQVDRRLLQGEVIPQHEKVFSIFEPHTRWIAKGTAGCPVELGVPVCILEDQHGFILHHEVMWQGQDVDYAVPMVETSQQRFSDLCAVSFDRGFHSPENRVRLDELLDHNVLPKKGCLNKAERGEEFVAMRGQHPDVESAINNLEHRGLDRDPAHGATGVARVVALFVVALNIHRIGLLLRRKARRRRAAWRHPSKPARSGSERNGTGNLCAAGAEDRRIRL